MKKYKKTLTVIIILIVAFLMFASFFGIYKVNEQGEKENLLPEFKLGMEFGKTRNITLDIDKTVTKKVYDAEGKEVEQEEGKEYKEEDGYVIEEIPTNDSSVKNVKNYRKTKSIIEERLKQYGVQEYFVDLDELTGKITVQIPENDKAEDIENFIESYGNFILLDSESFENVFDNNYFKKAEVVYRQGDTETAVCLQLSFNEEGTNKLQELNNVYVETTEEKTNEAGEKETVTNEKTVYVILNGYPIGQTVLPNITYDNKIILLFGMSNNAEELNNAVKSAKQQAALLNTGDFPVVYNYSNVVSDTQISTSEITIYILAISIVFVIAYIYLIIKYKAHGFISLYFQVGFLAVLLLVLRLTNVPITIEGIAGIVIAMILEYVFSYIVLRNMYKENENMYKTANLEFFLDTLPIYAIAVTFAFATRIYISSFGMTLFWGIILIYIYNFVFSKFILENLSLEVKK